MTLGPFDHPSFEGRQPHRGPETSGESRPAGCGKPAGTRRFPQGGPVGIPMGYQPHGMILLLRDCD